MNRSKLLDIAIKHSVGAARLLDIKNEILHQIKKGYLTQEDALYRPADQMASDLQKNEKDWTAELTTKGKLKTKARKYIKEAIRHGRLIKSEARYTTQTALSREKKILQIEYNGRKLLAPIMTKDIAKSQLESTNLNHGQQQAALLMTTTTNRIVGIQGFAGTGKSHMLKTSKKMIEENSYHLQALAPYGAQVKALKLLGIEARTLASFLKIKDKNINSSSVIVIDEAGVIPSRTMEQTLKLIEKAEARVVLIGDTAQTKAIEAGRPFDQLQNAGMSTAYMDKIERQEQEKLKDAVTLAAKGKAADSLRLISNITEIKDEKKRLQNIAADYTALSSLNRDKTIIVSGTNKAKRYLNQQVRKQLKRMGDLKGKELGFETLINRDSTQEMRKYSNYYQIGDIIIPERDYSKIGLRQNELYEVKDNKQGHKLTVQSKNGSLIEFSPMTFRKLRIYQLERAELAIGDTVRITQNDAKRNLVNSDRLKVKNLQEGHILLTKVDEEEGAGAQHEIQLPTNKPLHIDHAYATTVHSSQGLSADLVLIDIDTKSLTIQKIFIT